ncbi:MAG TPA: hypothetical protein VJC18_07515, partial [bacterium]|nr:hypothetical protein [bacterium]
NEVLLHELDTQAYNLSYFKRKLDLEIRRAHKGVHDVCLFYFAIDPLDQIITDHKIKKHIIINTTSCLLEKFPDPYIVGHVDNGQWLVIATSDFLHVGSDVPAIASQLTEHLNHELSSQGLAAVAQITSRVIKDLKSFKNSDDVLETVGSDSIL